MSRARMNDVEEAIRLVLGIKLPAAYSKCPPPAQHNEMFTVISRTHRQPYVLNVNVNEDEQWSSVEFVIGKHSHRRSRYMIAPTMKWRIER